ncbi:MAG: endonuclease [Acidimicrobiaceae bacterium]|nr:endonuclease [Acidimicrobiaceae bacterium]
MRVLVARCTVDYNGRLTAHLPEAVRLIMVKADGCVAVHADGGAYKPLNWMNAPNTLVVEEKETVEGSEMTDDSDNPGQKALGDVEAIWKVRNPKDEVLTITIHEVIAELNQEMGADPGLQKDGVEVHLQELLATEPTSIAAGLRLVRREYPTDIGPVDLLCRNADGQAVAVEVKRRGEIDGVEQLTRYLNFLNRDPMLRPVRGILVAQEIKPQAKVLAKDRGIDCVVVDYDELRGIESDELRLF